MNFASTWADFEITCQNKKLILYGLGSLLNYLFIRCKSKISIIASIDNDIAKQNHKLCEFFDETDLKDAKDIVIESKTALYKYNPDEVVILISSIRHSEDIAKDLESMNFHCYFSTLHLEHNYKEQINKSKLSINLQDNYIFDYAKYCAERFPIDNNKIIFGGMDIYPDHGRYITEHLLSMNKMLDIVWIINTSSINNIPKGVRVVHEGKWKQYIYELETAKFWLLNMALRTQIVKRPEQIYIQLKHWGSLTLKTFYLNEKIGNFENDVWQSNGKIIDYIVTGSSFDENSCRKGFDFHGNFLRFGSPRSDPLFQQKKYKEKIYKIFNLNSNERILLYAPTFRVNINSFKELNFELLLDTLKKKWNCNWKILIRFHPTVKINSNKFSKLKNIINVSYYENSQELVAASDILISDYSSIMFESAYVKRPVFLYAPDKEEYRENERDFLLDYDSLPFPISTTNEELSEQIINFDENKYKKSLQAFLDKYGVHEDGHASERVAKFIVELLESR